MIARWHLHIMSTACLVAALSAVVLAEGDAPGQPEPRTEKVEKPDKPATVRDVARDLLEQARQAVKKDYAWPLTKSEYADKQGLSLDSADVIAELCRSQDRNPAVDAYVKYQLLSFGPKLSEIDSRKAGRLIGAMPQYVPDASVPAREQATLSNYTKGQVAPPQIVRRAQQIQQYLQQQQATVDRANQPVVAYRKAVIAALPDQGGARLLARVQDLADQFRAGHSAKAIKPALDSVKADCVRLRTNPDLPAGARAAVTRKLQQIALMKYQTIDSITIGPNGEMTCKFGKVELNSKLFDEMKACLAGKQYVDPKKK